MEYIIIAAVIIIVAWMGFIKPIRYMTVYEYEKGLKFAKGKFEQTLEPGAYWYVPFSTSIQKIDMRPRFVSIGGQEVLSADNIALKISLAARYQVVNPDIAINKVQDYQEALYLELQLALREIIGNAAIDTLLENRSRFSENLFELTQAKIKELGLELLSVNIKDIMFPGNLKQMFAQVVKARKEGQAALEKARGETAALRNLANAAKMIESQPNLLNLRLLQSVGESSGNTLVLGMPSQATTFPIKSNAKESTAAKQASEGTQPEP